FCPPLKWIALSPLTERPLSTRAKLLPLGLGPLPIQPIKLPHLAGCWPTRSLSKSSSKSRPVIEPCDDDTLELLELKGKELVEDELLIDELEEDGKSLLELRSDELLLSATL